MMNSERLYMFNPWKIKEWTNEQVKEQFEKLTSTYIVDPVAPSQLAINIENLANQLYLLGEMIARLSKDVNVSKAEIKNEESKYIYKTRNAWVETNGGKVPAMSYFEALASEFVKNERTELAKLESDYKRFTVAYNALESKMNAVKKRLDAMKYEEFGV